MIQLIIELACIVLSPLIFILFVYWVS